LTIEGKGRLESQRGHATNHCPDKEKKVALRWGDRSSRGKKTRIAGERNVGEPCTPSSERSSNSARVKKKGGFDQVDGLGKEH